MAAGPAARSRPRWRGLDRVRGRRQVAQLRRTVTKNGRKTVEVVYLITSDRNAAPATLAAWVRRHWEIENRLHWVRDVTCRRTNRWSGQETHPGDRLAAQPGHQPAAPGRPTNIAAANRHHARDPQRTLRLLQAA